MNSYDLSRSWFDWCFENPEKINPNHTALFFFCIEHCNRLGWKEKFGLPTSMAKEAIGIRSYTTYKKTLDDLVLFGFIKMIEVSKNQHSSNIVALSNFNKALDKSYVKALDKALQKHSTKQVVITGESNSTINKQETKEQETKEQETILLKKETKENIIKIDYENFIIFWNKKVENTLIPKIEKLSEKRKKSLKSLFQDFSKEKFAEVLNIALKSDFLTGKTKEGFVLTFDFFSNKNNFIKVLEGNYSNKEKPVTDPQKIVASTQKYEKPLEPTEEEKLEFRRQNGLID